MYLNVYQIPQRPTSLALGISDTWKKTILIKNPNTPKQNKQEKKASPKA